MTEMKVLYNEQCPICSFEIGHYRDYAGRNGLPIRFDDLNGPNRAAWGLDADTAARRLYVLQDGELLGGMEAFRALWRQMPRYRWLARITALPGVRQAAHVAYEYALAPAIYRWHRRRVARQSSASSDSRSPFRQ